jgi:hypothetical protein
MNHFTYQRKIFISGKYPSIRISELNSIHKKGGLAEFLQWLKVEGKRESK